jgi:hypothetical protein
LTKLNQKSIISIIMADGAERPEFKIIAGVGSHDDDGRQVVEGVLGYPTGPMAEHESRFSIAEQMGIAPEDIAAIRPVGSKPSPEDTPARRAGRVSVGFGGGWNTSWVPDIDKGKDDVPILH